MIEDKAVTEREARQAVPSGAAAVLVVDDHRAAAEGLAELLRAEGYETYVAFDVDAGLKILEGETVDVVIADMVIPGMDGLDFLMMAHDRWPAVPFVILTGYGTIETAVEATRRGAYEYLTKPIDPSVSAASSKKPSRGASSSSRTSSSKPACTKNIRSTAS